MISIASKPANSTIEVQTELNRTILSWKNPRGGIKRIGITLFLIA
jgi:hypothetical protein